MLLSHRHQFIYTKTIKTGGTSVEAYFERFCLPPGDWSPRDAREESISVEGVVGFRGAELPVGCTWWNHMPAVTVRDQLAPGVWNSYFKFCVVRNPFEKAVSAFYFSQRAQNGAVTFEGLAREREKFTAWIGQGERLPIDRDNYLIDGWFCMDEFIRHETMADDLARVCARLGLPWQPALLPRLKAGIRPAQATVKALYTSSTRRVVEAVYAYEFSHFGYCFPEPALTA